MSTLQARSAARWPDDAPVDAGDYSSTAGTASADRDAALSELTTSDHPAPRLRVRSAATSAEAPRGRHILCSILLRHPHDVTLSAAPRTSKGI